MSLVGLVSFFLPIPVDGIKLRDKINFLNGEQKTLPAARRLAALATLSHI